MNLENLRDYIMQKRCAAEGRPFGPEYLVFKVRGKVFAIIAVNADPLSMNVKCDPDEALFFRDIYPAIRPGYHMNKRHWNTIILDGSIPDDFIQDMIDDSYQLVVKGLPKSMRPVESMPDGVGL